MGYWLFFIKKKDLLRPGEIQLDLTRLGLNPWCQGRYIISLYNIRRQVEIIIKIFGRASIYFLFILKINDIGILGLKELREQLKDVFKWVQNK